MKKIKDVLFKTFYIMNRQQKRLCVLVLFLTAIGSLLECLGVSVIVPLVNVIQNPSAVYSDSIVRKYPFFSQITYDKLVFFVGFCVIAIYIFKNSFFIFLSWVRIKFSCKIQREMSVKILTSYLSRGYQFFLEKNYGELYRGVDGDTSSVYDVLVSCFRIISELLTIFLICIFMLLTDWVMALSMMSLAVLCFLLIFSIFRSRMYKAGVAFREYASKAGQSLYQAFQGAKDVLLLRKQHFFIHEFEENKIEMQKAQCKQTVGSESPAYIIEGICVAGLMLVVCGKVILIGTDDYFISVLAAFAVGAFRILPSLGKISSSVNTLSTSLPSVNALYQQLLEAEDYAAKHPDAVVNMLDYTHEKDKPHMETFHNSLELSNISFRYNNQHDFILSNMNLSVIQGQSIAIIGQSGAGKSTVIDILLGLLLPQIGAIYMDGVKITDIPDKWADAVGYVPQSVFLSDTSIKQNIAFGERDEEICTERVIEALVRAELKEYVDSLPDGIDTYVGDRGIRLSGGQRQRIAIARALYHRPEILVLDEATSALDTETEVAIMSAINSLQGEVTLIIVAHRLSTIRKCDQIYEISNGGLIKRKREEIFND